MRRHGHIKVLIVDDSALVRSILTRVIEGAEDIQVIGEAKDPFEARELIIAYRPDVIILDIEMPRMDGITFLKRLMVHYPVPVIMCSGHAPANSRTAIEAIECGAIDVVAKPVTGGSMALLQLGEDLAEKIRAAVEARPAPLPITGSAVAPPASFRETGIDPNRCIVAIGASTGGTDAIRQVLAAAPADFPPTVMVQHMPEGFTYSFATRLNDFSAMRISEAVDGERIEAGKGVLARGGLQMVVKAAGGSLRTAYAGSQPVNRHSPSVDVLFDSVARIADRRIIGILLTGMGADGARGLLNMRQNGALTIAQTRESCVVYGMPKMAVELGAAQYQCAPGDVPRTIIHAIKTGRRVKAATAR